MRDLLLLGVLKREVIEGEKAEAAWKKVQKAAAKFLRTKKEKDEQVIGIPSGEDQEEELVPPKEPVGAR